MAANHPNSHPVNHRAPHAVNLHGYQANSKDNESSLNERSCNDPIVLQEELQKYSYLDDHDYFRKERINRNAIDKYNRIMHSIKSKSRDHFPYEIDEDDARDDIMIYDIERSPATSSTSSDTKPAHDFLTCYKKILKRHAKRLDANQYA